jgi:hypothetical protein
MKAVGKNAGYEQALDSRCNATWVETGAGSSGWTGFWGIAIAVVLLGTILLLAERVPPEAGLSIQNSEGIEVGNTIISHHKYH